MNVRCPGVIINIRADPRVSQGSNMGTSTGNVEVEVRPKGKPRANWEERHLRGRCLFFVLKVEDRGVHIQGK